jgi:hypothetical protein
MSIRRQTIGNVIWGLAFIAIAVVGGVVLGGIVGKSVGILIGGLCWAVVGGILLFQPATFEPRIEDDQYTVVATFTELPVGAWIAVGILAVGGIVCMIALHAVHF